MLDLNKIQLIAESYSPQELFAALVWQRRFNNFDGQEVIKDLAEHRHLWASFIFTKPIFSEDADSLSFGGVIDTLLAMANYQPMPESSPIKFVRYPADTLYILTENQDTTVAALLDLAKKWQADSVDIDTSSREEFYYRLKGRLRKTEGSATVSCDAAVICCWWD